MGNFAFPNSSDMATAFKRAISVTTSCGKTGMIIAQKGDSAQDIANMAMEMDEWLCG